MRVNVGAGRGEPLVGLGLGFKPVTMAIVYGANTCTRTTVTKLPLCFHHGPIGYYIKGPKG